MRRSLVDGMCLEAPVAVPGAPAPEGRPADWTLSFERSTAPATYHDVAWTGDAREDDRVWARFGRRADERIVVLDGVFELVADPLERRALVVHRGRPGWDVAVLRRAAPYLATLLGRTALHAATVVLPAGAVLLCGRAGAGKSTLALVLDHAGFAVLGDDHVVIEIRGTGGAVAHPSFPFADVDGPARRAAEDVPQRGGAPGAEDKASVAFRSPRSLDAVPIVAVALLDRGPRVTRERIPAPEALPWLLGEAAFVADPADDAAQVARLDACMKLLAAAPAVRLVIPAGLDRMAATAAEVATLWSAGAA